MTAAALDPADPRLEPPTWHGDELGRAARVRATRPGARQHGRPRRSTSAGCCSRTASATRCCSACCSSPSCSTSCRRWGSGGRAWPAGAAAVRAGRRSTAATSPSSTCSSRPTASRSTSSSRRSSPPRGCAAPRCASPCSTTATATRWSGWRCATASRYVRRTPHDGAKAGNINHALGRTDAPFVLVLDCDHVPYPEMLERLLPEFVDPRVAYVQSPQYYANHGANRLAGAAWSQQALFFGPIARGKDAHRSMICCGTNVVFRRAGARRRRRLPAGLADRGLRPVDRPPRAALGVGVRARAARRPASAPRTSPPTSASSTAGRAAASARSRSVLQARLPLRKKLQYLLSASYFLSGWTVALYLALPVIRILTGIQPLAGVAGRHVPRRLRPVLRAVAGDGRQRRRRDLHVRRLLVGHVVVLAPRPRHHLGAAAARRQLRGDPEGGRLAAPAAAGGAGAGRDRGAPDGRRDRPRCAAATRRPSTTSPSPGSTRRCSSTASSAPSRPASR